MTEKTKHPGGRPNDYTTELAKEICEEIENTPRSLDYICKQHPHFPIGRTVRRWLKQIPEFRPLYAQAKELQADIMSDEMLDIAYDDTKDWRVIYGGEGNEKTVFVPEAVNRARLKIDTLKLKTEQLAPKKYNVKNIENDNLESFSNAVTAMKELADKCLKPKN